MPDLARRLAAEFLGTALLLAAVVGSGIMAERLTTDIALALLCNTVATAAMLYVNICVFGPISGAHFNPAITILAALDRTMSARTAVFYIGVQILGAIAGVIAAHAMFDQALFAWGIKARTGASQCLSEAVAVFGLLIAIEGSRSRRIESVAGVVALYIAAAYWFTASTSFANPAVTIARALTPSFSGIRPADVLGFVLAQSAGALLGWLVARQMLWPKRVSA